MADPPFTLFHKDKVSEIIPHVHPKGSLQIPSESIHTSVFHSKPHITRKNKTLHSLDVHRVMAFYLQEKSPRLFVSIAEKMKGESNLTAKTQKLISGCILLCCEQVETLLPTSRHEDSFNQSTSYFCHFSPGHTTHKNLQNINSVLYTPLQTLCLGAGFF